ncbi:histone-lysine N-methyltransferase SETMAR-like [Teleopsis dalmanni]|uniref:histone-lysine N-methyltransferase SETMAR-like n=1 Tax=Teleopsis dalmanni TaxID=139649 RepID=UPI0018CE455F|nr:histone-lysine N-methyltransferase SETMAR-like [Teleopsis dalmanni]
MLKKTYGESCMSKTRTYEWYKSFKEGRTVAEDLPRSGRPSTSTNDENVEKAKKMVLQNCRVSEKEIAADLGISTGSARTILTDVLGMRRVSTRFVPKLLTFMQKEQRKAIAEDMIFQSSEDTTFIQRIITGDKMWVYEYDIDTNEQSTDWLFESGPISKKPRQSRTKPPGEKRERAERPRKEHAEKEQERIDIERDVTTDENSLYFIVRHSKAAIAVSVLCDM